MFSHGRAEHRQRKGSQSHAFIQRFSVLFTKPAILGLEILPAVMGRLIADMFSHRFDVPRTDAELAVSILPVEICVPRIKTLASSLITKSSRATNRACPR